MSGPSNEEAQEIFDAGQELLRSLHKHFSSRDLEMFDRALAEFYERAGLEHALCMDCDADIPVQLLVDGQWCPSCSSR
jgi:hypothetical protein